MCTCTCNWHLFGTALEILYHQYDANFCLVYLFVTVNPVFEAAPVFESALCSGKLPLPLSSHLQPIKNKIPPTPRHDQAVL